MRPYILAFMLAVFSSPAGGQTQGDAEGARMEAILKEAADDQATPLKEVAGKLTPLLEELRQLQKAGKLNPSTSRIFQESLLLLMRSQAKLLLPEESLLPPLHELLVVAPKIDEEMFNPREKLLLEKVRAAQLGQISLQTEPPGCAVLYAGTELGSTPLSMPLAAGSYRLLLRKDGYLDKDFEAVIVQGETLSAAQKLRKRTVEIPLAVGAQQVSVVVNGQTIGTTQPLDAWLASLPQERRTDLESAVRQWKLDPGTVSFFRLAEVPVGETWNLEFRAPCYVPRALAVTVADGEVDWNRPLVVRPELRRVELSKDTGFLEVTSTPAGGEVWLDGVLEGKTPLGKDVCSGMHNIQILHPSGQYLSEVIIRRGQVTKTGGNLKPAMAFVGIYEGEASSAALTPLKSEWEAVARRLALRSTTLLYPQLSMEAVEALRKKGSLPVERLLSPAVPEADIDALIRKIALDAGRVDLVLVGIRSGGRYSFRLHSILHPIPDVMELSGVDEGQLDFLVDELNKADRAAARLRVATLDIEALDSGKGLVVTGVRASGLPAANPLKPGAVIRSVEQKPMDSRALEALLRSAKPGQTISLEVASADGASALVTLPVRFAGTEYPWSTPDGLTNSVLAMLRHVIERDPISEDSKYASLALARGFMRRRDYKRALEVLIKTNLDPHKSGICPGTVLYYVGRCHEELGNPALAREYYARAKDFPDATVGTPQGLSAAILAEQRLLSLSQPGR